MTQEVAKRKERLDRGIKVRADSIYAVSSVKEILFLVGPRAALIIGVLMLPLLAPSLYWQRVICMIGAYALLAIGFDFLARYVGLVNLGSALFFGIGAYTAAIFSAYVGLPPVLTIPIATLLGAVVCTLLLLPTLPLRGIYFTLVTFVYPLLLSRLIVAFDVLGGTDGMFGLSRLPNIWVNQYLVLIVALLCCFGLRRFVNQDIGLVLRGIKDNDQAIRASGMNITHYKTLAVFITALMGCFSGAYVTHLFGFSGVSLLATDISFFPVAATLVGGPATLAGPVLGTLILWPLTETLRAFGALRVVFYSLVIVVFLAFRSEGLLNWARRRYEQFEHWVRV
jgi:branched-chain amino acid transport system permease protein